jgi:ABC-type Mn2+/Zn2+ transport system ATPase subunit
MMTIEMDQAEFGYEGRAVVHVDRLVLRAGCALGIFGPNGSGKTTLVRGITGLLPPLRGAVRTIGEPRIAFVPQQSSMESQWPMSGLDAASMLLSSQRRFGWVGSARSEILGLMQKLGVADLADRPFFRLSGGQQQRVLLAGAMVVAPAVLVLDEPTAGLDMLSRTRLLELLRQFTSEGVSCVMISHEIQDLADVCNEVAWLHPAKQEEATSEVELVAPRALVERLTGQVDR